MKAVINFSLFQYQCIELKKTPEIFTYKTDSNAVNEINKDFFHLLKEFNNSSNVLNNIFAKKSNHLVKEQDKINLIIKIFKGFGYKDEYINQYIGDSPIFQTKINSQRRVFFIAENKTISEKDKIMIIKPLFLDINHVVYNNKHFQKNFNTCLICWKNKCKQNLI